MEMNLTRLTIWTFRPTKATPEYLSGVEGTRTLDQSADNAPFYQLNYNTVSTDINELPLHISSIYVGILNTFSQYVKELDFTICKSHFVNSISGKWGI
jgi:hypothetical protein